MELVTVKTQAEAEKLEAKPAFWGYEEIEVSSFPPEVVDLAIHTGQVWNLGNFDVNRLKEMKKVFGLLGLDRMIIPTQEELNEARDQGPFLIVEQ